MTLGVTVVAVEQSDGAGGWTAVPTFLAAVQQQDGSWGCKPTARPPAAGLFRVTLDEDLINYSNAPHRSYTLFTVTPEVPRIGAIDEPAERTAVFALDAAATGIAIKAGFDFRDVRPAVWSLAGLLKTDEVLNTVDAIRIGAAGLAIGITVLTGDDRVTVDRDKAQVMAKLSIKPEFVDAAALLGSAVVVPVSALVSIQGKPDKINRTILTTWRNE